MTRVKFRVTIDRDGRIENWHSRWYDVDEVRPEVSSLEFFHIDSSAGILGAFLRALAHLRTMGGDPWSEN